MKSVSAGQSRVRLVLLARFHLGLGLVLLQATWIASGRALPGLEAPWGEAITWAALVLHACLCLALGVALHGGGRGPWVVALGTHGGLLVLALALPTPRAVLLPLEVSLLAWLLWSGRGLQPLARPRGPVAVRAWLGLGLLGWLLLLAGLGLSLGGWLDGLARSATWSAGARVLQATLVQVVLPLGAYLWTEGYLRRQLQDLLALMSAPRPLWGVLCAIRLGQLQRARELLGRAARELGDPRESGRKARARRRLATVMADLARVLELCGLAAGRPWKDRSLPALSRCLLAPALVPQMESAAQAALLAEVEGLRSAAGLGEIMGEGAALLERLSRAVEDPWDHLHPVARYVLMLMAPQVGLLDHGAWVRRWARQDGPAFLAAEPVTGTALLLLAGGQHLVVERLLERHGGCAGFRYGPTATALRRGARVLDCARSIQDANALAMADNELRDIAFCCAPDAFLEVESPFARAAHLQPGRMPELLGERRRLMEALVQVVRERGELGAAALGGVLQILGEGALAEGLPRAHQILAWWDRVQGHLDGARFTAAEGLMALQEGDRERALEHFQMAHAQAPDDDVHMENLCWLLCLLERFDEAQERARRWSQQGERRQGRQMLLGRVLEVSGHLDEAVNTYRQEEDHFGAAPQLSFRIGAVAYQLGDLDEAWARFQGLLDARVRQPRRAQEDPEIPMWLALVSFAKGEVTRGVRLIASHLPRSSDEELVAFLVEGLRSRELEEGHIADVLYALAQGPVRSAGALEDIVMFLESTGDFARAREIATDGPGEGH